MLFAHPEEEFQTGALERYAYHGGNPQYLIEFSDGESYVCELDAFFESDNIGDIEQETGEAFEDGNSRYDEFDQLAYRIIRPIYNGPRRYENRLLVDYRDFPSKVTDITNNVQVYPPTDYSSKRDHE